MSQDPCRLKDPLPSGTRTTVRIVTQRSSLNTHAHQSIHVGAVLKYPRRGLAVHEKDLGPRKPGANRPKHRPKMDSVTEIVPMHDGHPPDIAQVSKTTPTGKPRKDELPDQTLNRPQKESGPWHQFRLVNGPALTTRNPAWWAIDQQWAILG